MYEDNDSKTMSFGEIFPKIFGDRDENYHIPAEDGDFIDADNYLCCGKCGKHKEFRRDMTEVLGFWLIAPTLCDCQRAEVAKQDAEKKLREERMVVDDLFRYSLTDERFRESTFERYRETEENAKALRVCRRYVQHFDEMYKSSTGLLMYGSPGTGKTFSAACIANALMAQGMGGW